MKGKFLILFQVAAKECLHQEGKLKVVEAEQIFLLMRENFRISRNARASWYFRHLNECIDSEQLTIKKDQNTDEEFEVVSVLPQHEYQDDSSGGFRYKVSANTVVTFLAKHYRLVFVLDVSPSVASVDLTSERMLYGENYRSLHTMLYALTKPCEIPGSNMLFTPSLHVTILAHSPLINCFSNTVLIQGVVLTEDNIHCVLDQVRRGLDKFEQRVIDTIAPVVDLYDQQEEDDEAILMSGMFDETERPKSPEVSQQQQRQLITPELSLVNMLKYGILAMQLLPGYSTPGIVVITDGVLGLADVSLFESVMTQLRHNTISCSFVLTARDSPQSGNLGRVPHTELLQFIATATYGAYFSKMPELDFLDEISGEMNVIHRALLTWSFHRALEGFKIDDYSHPELYDNTEGLVSSVSRTQNSLLMEQIVNQPFLKTKHTDRNLHTHISNLVSCRLREGYTLKEVNLLKGESQIEVKLVMPWRDFAHIQYSVTSTWPLNTAKRHSHVEIHVEACYEFLHDVNCIQKKPPSSPYRNALIKKYREVLQGMSETDKLLVHLQSFTCNSVHYSLPESLRQKVPLFFLPTHSNTPRLNVQLNTKDSNVEQFASFWRPVLMLDVNIWQKWMHAHRIGLLLEHDMPLGKHLQIPNSSGNFHIVWCRQAQLQIGEFLREFCTFMLMENHSYIKFVFDEPDKPPTSFYIIRVSSKPPCLVLRLAFLGGTPGKARHQIMTELEDRLSKLQMSQRTTQTEEHHRLEGTTAPPPLQRTVIPCCVVTKKPVERLLIRYDRAPKDYSNMGCELSVPSSSSSHSPYSAGRMAKGAFFTLSRYLHHRRWIYSVQHGSSMPISTQAIGRILSSLTKVRLQQGFHFGQTNSGIINMVLEVDMKTPEDTEDCVSNVSGPCILQYIIFPPYTTTSVRDNVSEEEFLEDTADTDGELQVITECWVEPQCGEVVNSTPQRKYFDGLTYSELPRVMYPTDLECISTMITFEHLNLMCHSLSIPSPDVSSPQYSSQPPLSPCLGPPMSPDGATDIQYVPFPFDLLRVLPKCQQVELLFSTLKQDKMSALYHISQLSDSNEGQSEKFRKSSTSHRHHPSTAKSSTPNSLLFKNFMEYLLHIHDREIQLTEAQCQQLVPLIQSRERSTEMHPYPFDVEEREQDALVDAEDVEGIKEVELEDTQGLANSRRGSSRSLLTNYSVGSSTTVQSQVPLLQTSLSQTMYQSTNQSPIALQNPQPLTKTTPGGTQDSVTSEAKPMLGQIGKNTSSGSETRSFFGQSAFSATSSKVANLSFANTESAKPETFPLQLSNVLNSQVNQRSFSPFDDGKNSGYTTPRHQDLCSSVDQPPGGNLGTPKWRCFIKSVTSTHMMICFVPATYDDLLLLSYTKNNLDGLIAYARQSSTEEKRTQEEADLHKNGREKVEKKGKAVSDSVSLNDKTEQKGSSEPSQYDKGNENEQTERKSLQEMHKEDSSFGEKISESVILRGENKKKHQENVDPSQIQDHNLKKNEDDVPDNHINMADDADQNGVDENKENIDPNKKAEEVEPVKKNEEVDDMFGIRSCIFLPVYVYNCPLSYLTEQIVNKWTHKKPADIFEDLHFVNEEHVEEGEDELIEEDSRRCHRKTLSECEKWHLGTPEKVTDDIYANQVDLKEHCTLISETFFRSFVKSVFCSLQNGHSVDSNDVESAISSICEETIPIETDITEFLLKSCGHTRHIIERATVAHVYHEDLRKSFPGLVVNSKQSEESAVQPPPEEAQAQSDTVKKEPASAANMSHPVRLSVHFPLALLQNMSAEMPCEDTQGLHAGIKRNILDIMHTYFTAVPSSPEYLFYCPPDTRLEEDSQGEMAYNSENMTNIGETSLDEASQALQGKFQREPFLSVDADQTDDARFSVMSNKDSLAGHSSLDEVLEELSQLGGAGAHKSIPLFLQLVCSVSVKSKLLKSVPVRELPTCLGDLKACLEGLSSDVDLSEIRVTLDVICLTLPPEVDLSESTKRPCYTRMTSHTSCASSGDEDDIISHPTTTDYGLNMESGSDPLRSLPADQHTAILQCMERTRWLLHDEIASASRSMLPVTTEVLDTVAKHVKNSIGRPQCLHEEVQLQFVFGTEQTLTLFVQDFQKMNLPGYHLNKEGPYYYLYMDRAQASFHQALGNALSNRLVHINDRGPVVEMVEGEGALKCPHLSDSLTSDSRERSRFPTGEKGEQTQQNFSALTSTPQRSDVTVSDLSSPVKSARVSKGSEESQGNTSKNVVAEMDDNVASTPSSPEKHLVRQKAVDDNGKPELVSRDSQVSDISVFENEPAEKNETPKVPIDDSIEVLASDSDMTRLKELESELNNSETQQHVGTTNPIFRGDNIRISVTRPSPVREIPAENILFDNFENESSKEMMVQKELASVMQGTNKGPSDVGSVPQFGGSAKDSVEDRSRHSTGSSIQVIEEHEEEDEEDFMEANLNEAIRENDDMNKMIGSSDSSLYGSEKGEEKDTGLLPFGKECDLPSRKDVAVVGDDAVIPQSSGHLVKVEDVAPIKPQLDFGQMSVVASHSDSAIKKVDEETNNSTNVDANQKSTVGSQDHPNIFPSVSCDFTVPVTSIPQPIKNVGSFASDPVTRPIRLPDNKVDAFVKSVHFLKHQSPDTKGVDSMTLEQHVASLKTSQTSAPALNTSASSVNVQFSKESLLTGKSSPSALFNSPPEPERKPTIKRAHSSASIEKYRLDQDNKSQQGVVVRRTSQSGRVTPSRSRHHSGQSGPRTPLSSVFDLSSHGSYGEEGYEGDSSDTEEGTSLASSDALTQRHRLPDFWLILKIGKDFVDIYYHSRAGQKEPQLQLYNQVVKNIKRICHVVNQKLLLEDLYSTRLCNSLLVPEADEDIKWGKQDKILMQRKKLDRSDSDDSDDADSAQHYLAASMHISEGHFACEMVWSKSFTIHPRLRSTQGRAVLSKGVQYMRKVLQTFSVTNRKNMFVIKESVTLNVFYLRLIETAVEAVTTSTKTGEPTKYTADEEAQLSRSSSLLSLATKKPPPDTDVLATIRDTGLNPDEEVAMTTGLQRGMSFASERDFDQVSISSRSTAYHSRFSSQDDTISLVAHGITDVGEEISRDLVQMLQKKLNDAVLDILSDTLTRNPMSKLTLEDVQYIESPGSKPTQTIHLTVPASALLLQYALGFYLRQNLQGDSKLLFTPKYLDMTRPDGMFRDYTQDGAPPIAENDVFLYNRPHQSRSKGLACIKLSMVDGRGTPVQLLGSPKPSCQAYNEPFNASLFQDCVDCSLTEPDESIKVPGMTSLVRFQIWERGDIDIPQLTDSLLQALKFATCDLVLEYRLLTAPVCEPPPDVYSHVVTPTQSAPPTPRMPQGAVAQTSLDLEQTQAVDTEKSSKEKPAFSFQAITEIFKPSSGLPGTPKQMQTEEKTWQELEVNRRKEAELQKMIDKYESGKKGVLTSVYSDLIIKWFEFCNKLGCPSVQVNQYNLKSRASVEFVLEEMKTIVGNICSQTQVSVFHHTKLGYKPYKLCTNKSSTSSQAEKSTGSTQGQGSSVSQSNQGQTLNVSGSKIPNHPLSQVTNKRGYVHSLPAQHDKTEAKKSIEDAVDGCHDNNRLPGTYKTFILIGRSMSQWKGSLERGNIDAVDGGIQQMTKVSKTMQKFKPLEVTPSISKSAEKLEVLPSLSEQSFVPRQRFLIMHVVDKKITLYTYNWGSEALSSLDRQLMRVVSWQNARLHLLNCMISQKMGLFEHHLYGDPLGEANQQKSEMEALIKHTTPVQIQSQGSRPRREAPPHLVHPASLQFDDLYRDSRPACPMHKGGLKEIRDPVEKHGLQMLQLRAIEKKERERIYVLEKLYLMWQRVGTAHLPVNRDVLQLLKTSSRLVHTVSTPLMFCKQWRRNLSGDQPRRKNSGTEVKPRSRHGSGTSIRSQRSGSIDGKKQLVMDSPDSAAVHTKVEPPKEEAWHMELRSTFMQDYIQYIQSIGFYTITPQLAKHSSRPPPSSESEERQLALKYTYLQKTLPGGIMLIEIGFTGVHFGVHVYALECSQLHHSVNAQLELLFTDECDKFKDLTHVHSFTHDFHLRKMQSYISSQTIFKQGYHLTAFLKDFTATFSHAPCFARNLIFEGRLKVDKISSPGTLLFKYIMDHKKVYDVRSVEMHPQSPFETETEYALVFQHRIHIEDPGDPEAVQINSENYLVGVAVAHDPPIGSAMFELETKSIHLRYWVILTNEKHIFPVDKLERKLGMVKTVSGQIFPARSSSTSELESVSQSGSGRVEVVVPQLIREHHTGVKRELINYLGYSSTHQDPVYGLLMSEANKAQKRLQKMVTDAMVQCRRDMLWQRMLINTNSGEESALRRRHKSGWLDSDNANDPLLQRLSCGEFEELLEIVCKEPLYTLDRSLMSLHNMPRSWYQGLFKVLITTYKDYYRFFQNGDNTVQHLVIPNPKDLDMFMLATIDSIGNRTDLCAVFRKQSYQGDATTQTHVEAFVNTCCYHIWNCVL